MPYNIYDNRGNKVGQVTTPAEEAAAFVLTITSIIFAAPFFIAIALIVIAFQGFIEIYWPWAKTVHSLTPYANLNGVITSLAIPTVAFVISARWEKIVRGETKILTEFCWIAAIAYSAIGIVSTIPTDPYVQPQEVYQWFLIAPIAASALTYLRFKPIRVIIGLLVLIALGGLIVLGFVVPLARIIIEFIVTWLFS